MDVVLAVGGVGEAVHALAGVRVGHVRLDGELVLGRQAGQREAPGSQGADVQLAAVQHHPAEP
ncbi:hypothetical protein [Kitasatospora sp. NPDC015120]|uniref:hypothetical protein n=1 Tax=Kitasatospora sp. NPDC015120 TaxID=3364023 RepID=UPI0036F46585